MADTVFLPNDRMEVIIGDKEVAFKRILDENLGHDMVALFENIVDEALGDVDRSDEDSYISDLEWYENQCSEIQYHLKEALSLIPCNQKTQKGLIELRRALKLAEEGV